MGLSWRTQTKSLVQETIIFRYVSPFVCHAHQVKFDSNRPKQTELLNQPWATIDVILQAQQTWANKYAQGRWYQHCVPWDEHLKKRHSHDGGFGHFNAHECFEMDYQQALKWTPFRLESEPWYTQDIHPRTRVPMDLITGPWDDEKQRRLFWLCRGGMVMEGEGRSSLPWEIKLECLRNAILTVSEPNVLVVNCLVRSWVFASLPPDVVRKELVGLDRRLKWGGDSPVGKEVLRRTRNALDLFMQLPDFAMIE